MSEPKPRGRKPEWELRYLNKETDEKGKVGVGWDNEGGSIRIALNTKVVIQADPSCILTLFPFREYQGIAPGTKLSQPVLTQQQLDDKPF